MKCSKGLFVSVLFLLCLEGPRSRLQQAAPCRTGAGDHTLVTRACAADTSPGQLGAWRMINNSEYIYQLIKIKISTLCDMTTAVICMYVLRDIFM